MLVVAAVALVFASTRSASPPTNGANVSDPSAGPAPLLPELGDVGGGRAGRVFALGVAIAGLALSFTAD